MTFYSVQHGKQIEVCNKIVSTALSNCFIAILLAQA